MQEPRRCRSFREAMSVGGAMGDNQDNRRKSQLQRSEIEVEAIEALERARLLPPGARRHELLKEAGKLRMQMMVQRLSDEGHSTSTKGARPAANRRKKT
jgi:hypothetical protein